MTAKRKIQIQLDLLMVVILPFLMSYELIGGSTHECLGTFILFAVFLHHALNWHWHKNLMIGRYSGLRVLKTTINLLVTVLMASLIVTGVILSRYVFPSLALESGMDIVRSIHLATSYWCFILISIHFGLHCKSLLRIITQITQTVKISAQRSPVLRTIVALVIGYGVYAFNDRQIASYMFLQNEFVYFDFDEPILFFLVDYFFIMNLFSCLGYYFSKMLDRN